jgi:hypothetical protein
MSILSALRFIRQNGAVIFPRRQRAGRQAQSPCPLKICPGRKSRSQFLGYQGSVRAFRACGDLDKGAAQFVPMLAPEEAIVIGPDLPAPMPLFINGQADPRNSTRPSYQSF